MQATHAGHARRPRTQATRTYRGGLQARAGHSAIEGRQAAEGGDVHRLRETEAGPASERRLPLRTLAGGGMGGGWEAGAPKAVVCAQRALESRRGTSTPRVRSQIVPPRATRLSLPQRIWAADGTRQAFAARESTVQRELKSVEPKKPGTWQCATSHCGITNVERRGGHRVRAATWIHCESAGPGARGLHAGWRGL